MSRIQCKRRSYTNNSGLNLPVPVTSFVALSSRAWEKGICGGFDQSSHAIHQGLFWSCSKKLGARNLKQTFAVFFFKKQMAVVRFNQQGFSFRTLGVTAQLQAAKQSCHGLTGAMQGTCTQQLSNAHGLGCLFSFSHFAPQLYANEKQSGE